MATLRSLTGNACKRTCAAIRSATMATRSGSGRLEKALKASPAWVGSASLNAMVPASTRPSSSGNTTCMARSAAPSPRALSRHAAALGDGADDLEHRNARRIERRRLVGAAAGGKGRHGDDQRGFEPLERPAQKRARLAILQAGDEQRGRRQAARGERRAKRIDRRGVVGEQQRAVEDDRHDRVAGFE